MALVYLWYHCRPLYGQLADKPTRRHTKSPTDKLADSPILRQQKYNMRQWVASTAILSLVSWAPVNFATFAVPDTTGCDSILACRSLFSGSPLDMNALIRIEYTKYVTDGRTDTGQQQRPRLRIASRGKTVKRMSYRLVTADYFHVRCMLL